MCYTCIQCGRPLLIATYDMGVSHLVFHVGNRVDALSDVHYKGALHPNLFVGGEKAATILVVQIPGQNTCA